MASLVSRPRIVLPFSLFVRAEPGPRTAFRAFFYWKPFGLIPRRRLRGRDARAGEGDCCRVASAFLGIRL